MSYLRDLSIHGVGNGKIFPRMMETKHRTLRNLANAPNIYTNNSGTNKCTWKRTKISFIRKINDTLGQLCGHPQGCEM